MSRYLECESNEGTHFYINSEHITWVEYKEPGCIILFDNGFSIELNYSSTRELVKSIEGMNK